MIATAVSMLVMETRFILVGWQQVKIVFVCLTLGNKYVTIQLYNSL